MNGWSWLWLFWVAFGVAAELYVVAIDEPRNKLSQNVWALTDSLPGAPIVWRLLIAALVGFLAVHLSFGSRH